MKGRTAAATLTISLMVASENLSLFCAMLTVQKQEVSREHGCTYIQCTYSATRAKFAVSYVDTALTAHPLFRIVQSLFLSLR